MEFPPDSPRQWAEYGVFSVLSFHKQENGLSPDQAAGLILAIIQRLYWDETRSMLRDLDDTTRRIQEMVKHRLPSTEDWAKLILEKVLPPKAGLPLLVEIDYTNYRGERGKRVIKPIHWFRGSTEFHSEDQYLLVAIDTDKQAERTFAVKDIHSWQPFLGRPT